MTPLETLRHHVTGAIERGEATAIEGIPEKTHFRSGQYLHIKSEAGNYALRIEHGQSAHDAVLEAILASEKQIERLQRRLEHYKAFHRGESVSNPDALRV